MKKNKLLIILISLVVVLIIVGVIARKAGWVGQNDGIKVSVSEVQERTITETVSANGKVQPEVEIKISSDVSGEVRELYVKEGDSVRAGQLLARIDPELYQSALDRSEASLNNSIASLANSRARLLQSEARFNELEKSFQRSKKLYAEKLLSDQEFEAAKSQFESTKADFEASKQTVTGSEFGVKSFQAGVKEAKKNLTRTEIFAPANGIVSKLNVEKGERVVGTSQMAGTEMMRIANLNDMEVSVDVNENDIVKVSRGDSVIIYVDAYGNRKFKGLVTEIANSAASSTAMSTDQVTNFTVKIKILRSSYLDLIQKKGRERWAFKPGMTASVEIQTAQVNKAMALPIEAVTVRGKDMLDTSKKEDEPRMDEKAGIKSEEVEVVFVMSNGKASIREVKTGIQDDKFIEIISGVKVGDAIISGPFSLVSKTLKHGDAVKKASKEELFEKKE